MKPPVPAHHPVGSALMIMLWAVALLSATTLGLATYLQYGLEEDAARSKEFRARQLAESGIALALHPSVEKNDPVLRQQVSPVEHYQVEKISEGARININQAIADEEDTTLLDLFNYWGLDLDEAETVVDCLRDWVDGDDLARLSGIERKGYLQAGFPQYPRNQPFSSLDEVALCRGMDAVAAARPDWRRFFTVWSDGKINVNDADLETLVYAGGINEVQAEALVEARNGLDQIRHTEDDLVFEDISQVRSFLGMGDFQFEPIAERLTTSSNLERIVSTATVADYTLTVSALVQSGREGAAPSILAILQEE